MSPLPSPPVTDLHLFHPVLGELRRAAVAGEWPQVLTQLRLLDERHHQDFVTGATVVAGVPGAELALWGLLESDPDNRLAATLLAHREIERAWEARTAQPSSHVAEQGFERFHHLLTVAEQRLVAVCAVDPLDRYAWYLRQHTARGLELGVSEGARRWGRLQQAGEFHLAAAHARVQHLCPKWSDQPWETVLDFARSTHAAAPPGEGSEGLVAMVHLERFIQVPAKEATRALRQPEVRAELDSLGSSVASTTLRPTFAAVHLHSALGTLQAWSGNDTAAEWHFAKLGHLFDDLVWAYATHDLLPVSRARTRVLQAVGRAGAR